MREITVLDKTFEIFLDASVIHDATTRMARQLTADLHDKNPLFLVVLNGAFMFASDLLKQLNFDCEISFVKLSSYSGTKTTGVMRELLGRDEVLHGPTVVIVEDIIDTGITMANTKEKLKKLEATDVRLATLLYKPGAFQMDYKIDYVGIEIPNDFIVGYGLDYDGLGRNYPDIYKLKPEI